MSERTTIMADLKQLLSPCVIPPESWKTRRLVAPKRLLPYASRSNPLASPFPICYTLRWLL